MGLDLTLLPVEHDTFEWGFSHSMLRMDRDSSLFSQMLAWEKEYGESPPRRFHTYICRDDACEEPHYGDTSETPYGEPLRCVNVGSLVRILESADLDGGLSPRNRAALRYLECLRPESRVALYWS